MINRAHESPITPELAAQIVEHNRLTHAAVASLYDLSLPNMYHWYERRLLRKDIDLLRSLTASRDLINVLDVGSGTGRLALEFVRLGWSVDGLDLSPEMLVVCQAKYDALPPPKGSLRLICGDVEETLTAVAGPYDLISFSSVLHHLPHYLTVLEKLLEGAGPQGMVYITQEPMPLDCEHRPLPVRLIRLVDQVLGAPQQVRKQLVRIIRRQRRPQGLPLTDYHDRGGLDVPGMLAILQAHGFVVKRLRRYKDRKTGVMAWLDTNILHTPNWKFRLIAQRG